MKKIFILPTLLILAGCAETVALLGPATSALGGGNIVQSSVSSATSYGVKKITGKSPMEHALAYAKEINPSDKKDRCLSFVKKTESKACYIAKKQISAVKKSTTKKISDVINISKLETRKNKKILIKKDQSTLHVEIKKDQSTLHVKTKKEPKLKSVESILVESALNKKQILHLRVSIEKNYKTKDLSN